MLIEVDSAQTVIDSLLAENAELTQQLEYERTIRDLAEVERDEWRARARALEGQLQRLIIDVRYEVAV